MSRVRTVVATEILLVLGLLAFVGAAYAIDLVWGAGSTIHLSPLAAVGLSAAPALLWLGYFHAQDRLEPEPKHYVLGVFLLGAFVAGPLANFIIEDVVAGDVAARSFERFGSERLLRAFLVVGLAQELCKYLVVRYSVYLSPEFDEPMDGLIYMTAAGIGFATYENISYFQALDHVFLTTAAGHAVVTTLAHACFAGVLGYALGRAKFSQLRAPMRSLTLLVGLLVAAALNGQFELVEEVVKSGGMRVHPWRGVAYAAGFAAAVFFVISILMRRLLAISPFAHASEDDQ